MLKFECPSKQDLEDSINRARLKQIRENNEKPRSEKSIKSQDDDYKEENISLLKKIISFFS